MTKKILLTFHARLNNLIRKSEKTAYQVSKDINITQASMSKYRSGKVFPKDKTISKLAEYFDVDFEWLKTGYIASEDIFTEENLDKLEIIQIEEALEAINEFLLELAEPELFLIEVCWRGIISIEIEELYALTFYNLLNEDGKEKALSYLSSRQTTITDIMNRIDKIKHFSTCLENIRTRNWFHNNEHLSMKFSESADIKSDCIKSIMKRMRKLSLDQLDILKFNLIDFVTLCKDDFLLLIQFSMIYSNEEVSSEIVKETMAKQQNEFLEYMLDLLKIKDYRNDPNLNLSEYV